MSISLLLDDMWGDALQLQPTLFIQETTAGMHTMLYFLKHTCSFIKSLADAIHELLHDSTYMPPCCLLQVYNRAV
jgi:hypothetical protein